MASTPVARFSEDESDVSVLNLLRVCRDPTMLLVFCADSVVSQVWSDPPRVTHYDGATEECHILTGFITGSQAKGKLNAVRWQQWQQNVCMLPIAPAFTRLHHAHSLHCNRVLHLIVCVWCAEASTWETWMIIDAFLKQLDTMFASKESPTPASDAKDDHSICNWLTYKDICMSYTSPTTGNSSRMLAPSRHCSATSC